jgi:hypothetical protein
MTVMTITGDVCQGFVTATEDGEYEVLLRSDDASNCGSARMQTGEPDKR